MKNIIIYSIIFCFLSLFFAINVSAYSYIETSQGVITPTYNNSISNVNSHWGDNGVTYNYYDPWFYSIGQYWDAGAVKGTYINVSADYYFGIQGVAYSDSEFTNYLNSTLNTLTASNLVCGIGNIRQGYDSTFSKQITNFNVTYNVSYPETGGWQLLYHITFNYSQQIKEVNKNSTNMWCVFDRNPSNGLFIQVITHGFAYSTRYYYYNYRFDYSVTEDATVGAINDLNNSVNETNDKLDEITDMDIPEEDKELPDDSSYQDYNEAEGDLIDKVNSADMDSLDIAIDTDTSNFIWDTITDLFNSHPMIMSTIIALLSIGVIKLALGR